MQVLSNYYPFKMIFCAFLLSSRPLTTSSFVLVHVSQGHLSNKSFTHGGGCSIGGVNCIYIFKKTAARTKPEKLTSVQFFYCNSLGVNMKGSTSESRYSL